MEVEKHRMGIWPDSGRVSAESEESNALGDDARSFSINADLHRKTVVFDNSKAYEKKIRYIREMAEVCIQNYKVFLKDYLNIFPLKCTMFIS